VTGLTIGRVMGLTTGGVRTGRFVTLPVAPLTAWRAEPVVVVSVLEAAVGGAGVPAAVTVPELEIATRSRPVVLVAEEDVALEDEAATDFTDCPRNAFPRSAADSPVDFWPEAGVSDAACDFSAAGCRKVREDEAALLAGRDSCWLAKAGWEPPAALRPSIPAKPTPASAMAV
jgi:hypothetical protein